MDFLCWFESFIRWTIKESIWWLFWVDYLHLGEWKILCNIRSRDESEIKFYLQKLLSDCDLNCDFYDPESPANWTHQQLLIPSSGLIKFSHTSELARAANDKHTRLSNKFGIILRLLASDSNFWALIFMFIFHKIVVFIYPLKHETTHRVLMVINGSRVE